MADYADLVLLAQDNRTMTVKLSPESLAVIFSSIGESLERLYKWTGSGEFGGLSDAEKASVNLMVAQAEKELMSNPLIGIIFPFVNSETPENALLCDGSEYNRVDYPELYAKLNDVFLTGADTFVVPDLTARVPIGEGFEHDIGEVGGEESVELEIQNLPIHAHGYQHLSGTTPIREGEGLFFDVPTTLGDFETDEVGEAVNVSVMQPYLVVRWAIWAT